MRDRRRTYHSFFRVVGPAAIVLLFLFLTGFSLLGGSNTKTETVTTSGTSSLHPTGSAQLVSVEPLPVDGAMCPYVPTDLKYTSLDQALAEQEFVADAQEASEGGAGQDSGAPSTSSAGTSSPTDFPQLKPVRTIHDPYSDFSAVAVDPARNEIAVTDENLFNVLIYDRRSNTPPNKVTEPIRKVGGLNTDIEFQCGIYADPNNGDIYAVNNDTEDHLTIFSDEQRGDVAPARTIHTPHGTFGIAVDEKHQEIMLTEQHDNAVVAYHKDASTEDSPIRLLQGDETRLADPHGMTYDPKDDVIFVANHGSLHLMRPPGEVKNYGTRVHGKIDKENWPLSRDDAVPGSGKNLPPSINVYARTASGDAAPLREITGPKTQLDWPTGLAYDEKRDEIYVANDMGNSILVFSALADGDVAPLRVLKGPQTLIKNPTGLSIDSVNDELWVANFGDHTVAAYKPTATGDTPPLRVIRSAPAGQPTPESGNPSSVAYDSKREQLLVPN